MGFNNIGFEHHSTQAWTGLPGHQEIPGGPATQKKNNMIQNIMIFKF